jgi:tetratricopeptide (TPR) repeat protein
MMSDGLYVRLGPKTVGPLTEQELRGVLKAGRITPETPVRRGNDGPWIPASQALADATNQKTRAQNKRKPRTLIAIAALVGVAVLVAVVWGVLEIARRRPQPAIAVVPPDDGIKSKDDAPSKPALETPPVRSAEASIPATPRQSLIAKRPSSSTANNNAASVTGDRTSVNAPPVEPAKRIVPPGVARSQQTPVDAARKPITAVAKVSPVAIPKKVPPQEVPQKVPRAPATQADLRALETMALHSSTAKNALALYAGFRATRPISPSLENLFKANRQVWEDRARQDLVRLGDQWVAAADAARAHEEAAQLFQQANELAKNLNFEEARRTLETASRVDSNSIAADFTLGILSSITPPKLRNPQAAAKHFQAVLQRIPGYVPALNNLAIAEIRQDQYAEAVQHLREAADRAPTSEEVTQNLGRLVSEARLGRIHPSESVLSNASELYSQVVTTMERTPAERGHGHGWRYMPLVLPPEEREGLSRLQAPEVDSTGCVTRGTGLVVAPHYVLTCRHVVDDLTLGRADKIELIDPADGNHQRRLPAVCVDVDQEDDLCLLRCDQLNVPPIRLADQLPPRGREVMLIGYPVGSWSGVGLKTTRGIVTALPGDVPRIGGPKWADFSRKLWYDATSKHGPIGGAVCDDRGTVLAIHSTSQRPDNDTSTAKDSGGVPAPLAAAFIRSSLPTILGPPTPRESPAIKWSAVEAKVSPSLVLVVVGYRKIALVMSAKLDASPLERAGRRTSDIYDDRFCSVCNGLTRLRCPSPTCPNRGESLLNGPTNVASSPSPAIGTNTPTPQIRHICPTCLGTGHVRCPHCSVGIDPLLR